MRAEGPRGRLTLLALRHGLLQLLGPGGCVVSLGLHLSQLLTQGADLHLKVILYPQQTGEGRTPAQANTAPFLLGPGLPTQPSPPPHPLPLGLPQLLQEVSEGIAHSFWVQVRRCRGGSEPRRRGLGPRAIFQRTGAAETIPTSWKGYGVGNTAGPRWWTQALKEPPVPLPTSTGLPSTECAGFSSCLTPPLTSFSRQGFSV